jgi:hypothetical protein
MDFEASIGSLEFLELAIQCMTVAGISATIWTYWIRPGSVSDPGEVIAQWGAGGFVAGLVLELISELV